MFSQNSMNSVTEKFVYSKRIRTCHLLCKRPGCYHSASKTHVRDRIFKLRPIHASLIISFPEFTEFSESSAPFRKNSIALLPLLCSEEKINSNDVSKHVSYNFHQQFDKITP